MLKGEREVKLLADVKKIRDNFLPLELQVLPRMEVSEITCFVVWIQSL